jgi:hypothetical protein
MSAQEKGPVSLPGQPTPNRLSLQRKAASITVTFRGLLQALSWPQRTENNLSDPALRLTGRAAI